MGEDAIMQVWETVSQTVNDAADNIFGTLFGQNSQEFGSNHRFSPSEWLVKFRNPFAADGQWAMEPTYLGNETEVLIMAFLTFMHAYRHGGRYLWLWFTAIAHGITVELVSYWVEPIDNFWHAQTTFMFFGQREPIHIFFLYPAFIYTSSIAVSRLGFSELSESCAVGLMVVLFDMPYDIMGIKLLWWTWHDTDANIRDRHYWVPWNSYYFHATFAFAFSFLYHRSRRYFVGTSGLYSRSDIERMPFAQQLVANNWKGELKALLFTGAFSMPFGILQFVPGWHLFGDIFQVHGEVTFVGLAAIYMTVIMYGFQHATPRNLLEEGEREVKRGDKASGRGKWYYDEVVMAMLYHYFFYMFIVVVAKPETYQVLGLHQPQGSAPGSGGPLDCAQMRNLTYPYPFTSAAFPRELQGNLPDVTVWKRPYLCEGGELMDEKIFNFNCPNAKAQTWTPGSDWFWICGTGWDNDNSGTSHVEYILVIYIICITGILVFSNALLYPRNIFEQIFVVREFPRYYLTDTPDKVLDGVLDSRVSETTGKVEYKIRRVPVSSGKNTKSGELAEELWETKDQLVQDAVGPRYGERGGLYGVLYDSYGDSTRDRLRAFDAHQAALERLKLFDCREERRQVTGVSFVSGMPKVASEEDWEVYDEED